MGRLFGTDGIRGIANVDLDSQMAFNVGRAGAYVLMKEKRGVPKILIGADTRISMDMLQSALIAGICSVGAVAVPVGIIPTPAISYLVRKYSFDAGIAITASHNTAEYNGIKYFSRNGSKLPDALEDEIEDIVLNRDTLDSLPKPSGGGVGVVGALDDPVKDYVEYAASKLKGKLGGLTVAIDCANGASYKTAPCAMLETGAKVLVTANEPDGLNINKDCGSTHIEQFVDFVLENESDVGFAFDGDADRCFAVDEKGGIVDGDCILAICGMFMKEKGILKDNVIVATVMSNLGLFEMGAKNGIDIKQAKVGDKYVLEMMQEGGYSLGGEQSGHIIFLDESATGDGLLTAMHVMEIMHETGKKLSELASAITVYPQVLVGARVLPERINDYSSFDDVRAMIERLEQKYEGAGRILIRPSGTEPLVRVMIEGKNLDDMQADANNLAALIEEKIGN